MKSILREVKNLSYEPVEIKVRDATSNEPWGPTTTQMAEIARDTHNYRVYPKLFQMVWKRICDLEHILHVQKALLLTEYLVRNGHERFVQDVQRRVRDIERLKKYKYYNENHEDIAGEVRTKAGALFTMISDQKRVDEERKKAENMRDIHLTHASSDQAARAAYYAERQQAYQSPQQQQSAYQSAYQSSAQQQQQQQQQQQAQYQSQQSSQQTAEAKLARDWQSVVPEDGAKPKQRGADSAGKSDDDPFGASQEKAAESAPAEAAAADAPPKKKKTGTKTKGKKKTKPKTKVAEADGAAEAEAAPEAAATAAPAANDDGEIVVNAQGASVAEYAKYRAAAANAQTQAAANPANVNLLDMFGNLSFGAPAGGAGASPPAARGPPVSVAQLNASSSSGRSSFDLITGAGAGSQTWETAFFADADKAKANQPSATQNSAAVNAAPVQSQPAAAKGDMYELTGIVNLDNIKADAKKDKSTSAVGGISMGQMSELNRGVGSFPMMPLQAAPARSPAQPGMNMFVGYPQAGVGVAANPYGMGMAPTMPYGAMPMAGMPMQQPMAGYPYGAQQPQPNTRQQPQQPSFF